jgi:glyoxylase-like metal-dependent hydrolase (beta-lactamase superfamily II)
MHGNVRALADISIWRKPDVTFDRFLEIDLGGRTVELWHFGPGNAPGDTVVYAPSAKVAWTGNFLGHSRIAPMLLEGSPVLHVASLKAMKETLDVRTIVPGHGPVDDAQPAINSMIAYLEWLYDAVSERVRAGDGESDLIDLVPPPDLLRLPAGAPGRDQLEKLNLQMHRLNVHGHVPDFARWRVIPRSRAPEIPPFDVRFGFRRSS